MSSTRSSDGTDTENDESENDQTEGEPSQDNNEGSTDLLNEEHC